MKLNNYFLPFLRSLGCLLFPLAVWGQINITFPTSRIVFQRDNGGNGTIFVTGQYSQNIDRVEVRVVPMSAGQGEQTDWRVLQNAPQGGFYSGKIQVRGGWYELQVRGIFNNNVISTAELQRVGVGEVFLVAGQSNAQGFYNYGAPGTGDDRVNCVNYRNVTNQNNSFPQPNFVRMGDNSDIGPRGLSAWCWGRLGDILASRLNVPILFYNAAWEGTASKNWSETVDGGITNSIYVNDSYPIGQPYGNLRMALNYYASTTGLRAVLWHQGEADNQLNTSAGTYRNNLQNIISKSRQHFGRDIGWVISRVSYYNSKGSNQEVINGQNELVTNTHAVFFGPNTDGIQVPRPDGFHFQNQGLSDLANAWSNSLDDNFFNSCFPQTGNYPSFSVSCVSGNQLNINVQGVFTSVQWNNGAQGSSVNFGPGNYQATIRDGAGNVYFTPQINVPNDIQSAAVNIQVDGKLPLCQGSSVTLISSNPSNNQWNTGSTNQRLEVNSSGTYTVSTKNLYGCSAQASITVTSFTGAPPAKPTISPSGATTFCQGGEVTLTATEAAEYRWSTGDRGRNVVARNTGNYEVRVLDAQGCISEPTSLSVQVNSPPAAPSISASGNTTFCEGGKVLLSSNYASGNIWSTGQQTKDVEISSSGTYNVRFRDANGCDGISNNITVTVNPLPSTPIITRERPTTFCEGDYTVLAASSSAIYNWNNGEKSRRLTISKPGDFSLTVTDANGCTSATSEVVNVKVNPLPAAPTITVDRNPVICENEVVTLTSSEQSGYIWSNGQNTRSVTVNISSQYSVRTVDANQCQSLPSNVISLRVNPLPAKPIITAQGPTTFCDGGQVTLSTNYDRGINWSSFQTTQSIVATKGGNYNVSYVDDNGCRSVSDAFVVTVHPLPAAPTITNEKPTTFCMFDNTVLTITSPGEVFNWSNGGRGRSITVFSAGQVSATVFEPRTGCTSPASQAVQIVVNPIPDRPTITATGPTAICADKTVTLTATDASAYQWSNQGNTKSISVNVQGNYTVVVRNQFGCASAASEPIFIKVNPLPNAPTVIAEGRTTFCDGDQVALRVDAPLQVIWNTSEEAARIIAKQSGNYAARLRDEIGCQSPFSSSVRVDVKTLPATPVIAKVGVYSLQVDNITPTATYTWKVNNQNIGDTQPYLKTGQVGSYTVFSSVQHSSTLTCVSKISTAYAFEIDASSTGLGVYPNPSFDGKVIVETLENLKDATVVVYDVTGKVVSTAELPSLNTQVQFDFRNLAIGTYYLQVLSKEFKQTKKIVISKP
ncbi:T9SS type A sorting domain-containing protein [Runella zeae]|uniref:T9SS type A sorting domain-containing protein n=1 Tax=Runella zeae TaxID=94255 RepID=UPI000405C788|nr:sialate O-acetylesterase [Runella zeae]